MLTDDSLTTGVPHPDRLDLLFQFILTVAAGSEDFRARELGPIHLLKYAYLADVAYASRHDGETFTGTSWRFYHFGPWNAAAWDRIEPALQAIGAGRKSIPSKFGDDSIRYGLEGIDRDEYQALEQRLEAPLPMSVIAVMRRAVHEYGSDTADLLRHVYLTQPMLAAKPGDLLDLSTAVRPVPAIADAETDESQGKRSAKQRKEFLARIAEARTEIANRLASGPRGRVAPTPAPRYDEVFFEGTAQLDELAGKNVTGSEGTIEFDDSVWTSAQRRDTDLS